ncbi:MAG: OmpA family protein [Chitinophagales bacterium]|nr:OmpA family protein [Bacteroidota bacterium]MCB9043161.1 OmpA family protein [Chitinophagales bacterium]
MRSLIYWVFFGLFLWVAPTNVQAQKGKLKKANKLYEQFAYPEAAELYKKYLAKNQDPQAVINLADCYRFMNQPAEAEYWFEQVMRLPEYDPIHKLYYGMALKMNGKCDIARAVFLEYAQLVPADTRGLRMAESCDKEEYFLQDPGTYELKLTNINSDESDFGPAFYQNGLVFASARGNKYKENIYNWTQAPFLDLYFAERLSTTDPSQFGKVEPFKGQANTVLHEGTVTFSKDGNTMFFTRNNFYKGVKGKDSDNTINLKIYSATKEGENSWGNIQDMPFNSDEYSVGHPSLSADGQALYFVSNMPGGYGEEDIYVSYKQGNTWSAPENLGPEINTEGREMFPFIHEDGTLFFSSDALPGLGGLDVFSSHKDNGIWTAPENLRSPINTNFDDFGFILDSKKEFGYLASNRAGGRGDHDDDMYSFTRTSFMLNGIVVDLDTQSPIEGAKVKLYENGVLMQERISYSNGGFSFPISPNKEYRIVAEKNNYDEGEQIVSTVGLDGPALEVKINLKSNNAIVQSGNGTDNCILQGVIYDDNQGSKIRLQGATIKLINTLTKYEKSAISDAQGAYYFELEPETDYVMYATKELYFTATRNISTKGRDCSNPATNSLILDIALTRIQVDNGNGSGGNITDINNIPEGDRDRIRYDENGNPFLEGEGLIPSHILQLNHIYYDLDKADIRPDATAELDKVVALMYQNPGIIIELGSHTDSRASDAYNKDLSQRRADAAVKYIVSRGISRDRIIAKGYGETRLANECFNNIPCNEQKHQENRRTEFKVIGYTANAVYSEPRYFGTGYGRDVYLNSPTSTNTTGNTNAYDYTTPTTTTTAPPPSYTTEPTTPSSYDNYGLPVGAGVEYRIQLGAFRKPNLSRYAALQDLGKIEMENNAGVYKLLLGHYPNRDTAENIKQQVQNRGFRDAFVVVYQNGVRIE